MHRQKASPYFRPLLISLAVSAAVLAVGMVLAGGAGGSRVVARLIWPLTRLMLFIGVGLAAGQVIEASGWTKTLAVVARPAFRFGHLGHHCSAAFTTAFFSGVTANAMLLDFYKEGRITRRQLFLSNFVNQLPAFFLHLPTTFFIVIPLTGAAGVLYFLITFSATILRTAAFLLYGHLRLPGDRAEIQNGTRNASAPVAGGLKNAWPKLRARLPRRFAGIAVYVVPIYTVVFVLNALGLFKLARHWLATYVATTFVPMESLSLVILSFAAEFTSGFAAAGALLDAGMLTTQQTVIALLLGNIVAFPVRALRHQLPRYIGIFAPKMGSQLLLLGQGLRILSLVVVGLLYYVVS